jgi:hypothetical protein
MTDFDALRKEIEMHLSPSEVVSRRHRIDKLRQLFLELQASRLRNPEEEASRAELIRILRTELPKLSAQEQ